MSLPGARLLGYATAPWSLKPLASGSMGEVAVLAPTSCGDVLRRISRLIVEDARPSRLAISRIESPCRRSAAIRCRSSSDRYRS